MLNLIESRQEKILRDSLNSIDIGARTRQTDITVKPEEESF